MGIQIFDSFETVPGGRVFVRRWKLEPNLRAPILLVHDSLGSVELWRDFPEALVGSTGRSVIAYDRLGFGQSTPRRGLPSVDFIVEEAEVYLPALLQALNLDRVVLLGHSVGCGMALIAASIHPEMCESVVSVAAQAYVEPLTLSGIRSAEAKFKEADQVEKLAKYHGEKARWVLDAWTKVWLSPGFSSWSLEPYLPRVLCPVLAIHGDQDEYGSVAFPRRIVGLVGGASELAILEHCGHGPHREKKELVLQLVASFLES